MVKNILLACVLTAAGGYLLGSILFGVLISKVMYNDDVRNHGSGNAGMTNVLRTYGKLPAVLTTIGDVGKSVAAVNLGRFIFDALLSGTGAAWQSPLDPVCGAYLAAIFCMIGHSRPIFFGFKGGKGVLVGAPVMEGDFTEEAKQQLIEANEEVLIQRQTDHVRISGVVFTRDIIYNRPYYMVTYDDNGSTDSVTSGVRGKTKWIAKNASREFLEYEFVDLLTAVKEIEQIYEYVSALDIEFAILEDGTVVIFQVRPLAAALKIIAPMTDREFKDTKALAKCKYLDTFHILSDMAFWNPAEIIGR